MNFGSWRTTTSKADWRLPTSSSTSRMRRTDSQCLGPVPGQMLQSRGFGDLSRYDSRTTKRAHAREGLAVGDVPLREASRTGIVPIVKLREATQGGSDLCPNALRVEPHLRPGSCNEIEFWSTLEGNRRLA